MLCSDLLLAAGSGKDAARRYRWRRLVAVFIFPTLGAFFLSSMAYGQIAAVLPRYPQTIDEPALARFLAEAATSWQALRKGLQDFQADCSIETTAIRAGAWATQKKSV